MSTMTKTAAPSDPAAMLAALGASARQLFGLIARVMTGLLLLAVASVVALMTAVAGLMLAAAALVMRFASERRMQPAPAATDSESVTLEARRTPRGWTVE